MFTITLSISILGVNHMKDKVSDRERFILLWIFSILVLVYFVFGIFKADINPVFKMLPFLASSFYLLIRTKQ